jgi:peroxiredoxin
MNLETGQSAPAFTLFNSERKETALASYRGKKVLILFFPAAFTSTCTRELCGVRDELSYYNDLNTEVIAISTDALYSLAKYKEEQKLNFTLASDFNKEVCGWYGAQYEVFNFNMKGVARRAAFVVDEAGIITYAEVLQNASDVPDFGKIKAALEFQRA